MNEQKAPNTTTVLKQLCLRLRNADPHSWDEFVQCFDIYTSEVLHGMATAPQDAILNMQGRAQVCQALLRLFSECHLQKPPAASRPALTDLAGI